MPGATSEFDWQLGLSPSSLWFVGGGGVGGEVNEYGASPLACSLPLSLARSLVCSLLLVRSHTHAHTHTALAGLNRRRGNYSREGTRAVFFPPLSGLAFSISVVY